MASFPVSNASTPSASAPRKLGARVVERRSADWGEHQIRWRFLQDSYEGGNRYRQAQYGTDSRGLPIRNLIRHKREYPTPREMPQTASFSGAVQAMDLSNNPAPGMMGADASASATDDAYEYRLARTPVPRFVGQACDLHLARIFAREVKRESEDERLTAWWRDVDGCGTSIDDWMRETIGPLLSVCGNLDIAFDHPVNPDGTPVESLAAQKALGLDRCVASYILPENMVWWQLDARQRYTECLVREYCEDEDGQCCERFRHWTATESTLYSCDGDIIDNQPHGFGRVPIVRLKGTPKFRCKNIGASVYEEIAELQREYYNRDSELVLSDSLQAHPQLQAPEDYCRADGQVATGPDHLLPMKGLGSPFTAYESWQYLDPPKGAADSIRTNKTDIRDAVDRAACLTKPAGSSGSGGSTVAQSGISKQLDQIGGNDLLTRLSAQFGRAERQMVEFALLVLNDRPATPAELDAVTIDYPTEFDLYTASDLAAVITDFQGILATAGDMPETEFQMLSRLVKQILPGLRDDVYEAIDTELTNFLAEAERHKAQAAEGVPTQPLGQALGSNPAAQSVMPADMTAMPADMTASKDSYDPASES